MVAHFFVWLFVFAVPWQNVFFIPGLGTASKIFGIGAMGATVMHVIIRGRVRPLTPFHWAALLYLMWVFVSAFWAIAKQESVMVDLETYLSILIMLWVLWEGTPTPSRLISLMQAYVLGAYVAAGSTVFNYLTGGGSAKNAQRFAASGFDPNDLGMLLALAIPLAWFISSRASSGLQRWVARAYFVVGTLGILLTSSRGALLAACVGLCVIPWTLTHVRAGVKVAIVVVVLATAVAVVQFIPQTSFERLATTGSQIEEGDLNNRMRIWKEGILLIPTRPLLGYGVAGWFTAVGMRIGNVAPHNTFIAIAVEEGLVGLFFYICILLAVLMRLLPLPTFERRVGLIQLATLGVAITPLGWHQHKGAWLMLSLLAAWPVLAASQSPVASPRPAPATPRWPARGAPRFAAR
jgi:O-antigen ligase